MTHCDIECIRRGHVPLSHTGPASTEHCSEPCAQAGHPDSGKPARLLVEIAPNHCHLCGRAFEDHPKSPAGQRVC